MSRMWRGKTIILYGMLILEAVVSALLSYQGNVREFGGIGVSPQAKIRFCKVFKYCAS